MSDHLKDILQLINSNQVRGRIDKYSIGHSSLWIRVNDHEGFLFYLHFYDVQYLSGMMGHWISINLTIADELECQKFYSDAGFADEFASYMATHSKLFEVRNGEKLDLRIVSAGVSKIDDDILSVKSRS